MIKLLQKVIVISLLILFLISNIVGCGSKQKTEQNEAKTEIQVFAAASLRNSMEELVETFRKEHPEIEVSLQTDSSGTLMTQIQEGYECDIFFSAAQKQMDILEAEGRLVEGTRADALQNQLVVITYKGSQTAVTGLETMQKAKSIALANGSVPVGAYTRQAWVNLGVLEETEENSDITTQQISGRLGGVEISEQSNVSKVLWAVLEGSCDVGTTYYSDTYGYEEQLEILEWVNIDLTGDIIYPICRIQNEEADELQKEASQKFYEFVLSQEAKHVFEKYYFKTNAEGH